MNNNTTAQNEFKNLCNRCGKWFNAHDQKTETMEFEGDTFEFIRCPHCKKIWGGFTNRTYARL